MKNLVNGTFFCTLLFATAVFGPAISAQGPDLSPPAAKAMADVQPPNPKGSDPKPEDAIKAILSAFDKYQVVGMGAAHRNKSLHDFILDLVRNSSDAPYWRPPTPRGRYGSFNGLEARFLLADNTFTIVRSGTWEEQRNPVSHV
jgi:hypothetical protein